MEGVIEEALAQLFQKEINIIGQGRTDAGVHAKAQIAHADFPDTMDTRNIFSAMKSLLPVDVALVNIVREHSEFHARFDAVSRTYRYQLMQRPAPLFRHICWFVFQNLDREQLHDCAASIIGEHDFINFCIPSGQEFQTTICTISDSRWSTEDDMLVYHISGNRFLRHMVRRLVGSMVKVASGQDSFCNFNTLLINKNHPHKGHSAPSKGLILEHIDY